MLGFSSSPNGSALYQKALDILNRLPSNSAIQAALASKKLSNETSLPEMRALMERYSRTVGDLKFLRAIHVSGSKGKGSTCAFAERLLRALGLKTGLFTSPHLVDPRERIRINGQCVDKQLFTERVIELNERLMVANEQVSFFRFCWLLAIDIFYSENIDVGVIEVGMGGRFDATNVIDSPVSVGISFLSMEHVNLLGPDLERIAWHKAGIMKSNVPAFTVPQRTDAAAVLEHEAQLQHCPLTLVNHESDLLEQDIELGIPGEHQRENALLAVSLVKSWISQQPNAIELQKRFTKALIEGALKDTFWPGRQQIHRESNDLHFYLDGSHTIESVQYTQKWFAQRGRPLAKKLLLFHCSADRNYAQLLQPLTCMNFDFAAFVDPDCHAPGPDITLAYHQQLADHWKMEGKNDRAEAFSSFVDFCQDEQVKDFLSSGPCDVLVCGSLYLVGTLMKHYSIST